jgi:hypothetical protein
MLKQELNSSETSCDRVGGLIGGVVKKAGFSMVERGLVIKVSFSSVCMIIFFLYFFFSGNDRGQKVYFSMAGLHGHGCNAKYAKLQ